LGREFLACELKNSAFAFFLSLSLRKRMAELRIESQALHMLEVAAVYVTDNNWHSYVGFKANTPTKQIFQFFCYKYHGLIYEDQTYFINAVGLFHRADSALKLLPGKYKLYTIK
jgi:hypothetical protein